jgi:hypothetical protein
LQQDIRHWRLVMVQRSALVISVAAEVIAYSKPILDASRDQEMTPLSVMMKALGMASYNNLIVLD